jgi:hypothetical protein
MIYLIKEDLVEVIQEKLLDDSLQLDDTIIDGLEKKAIAFAVSYISGRYKVDEIFGGTWYEDDDTQPTTSIKRSPLLVQSIAMIVVYRAVRRNAARKVPDDYTDIYKEAIRILENTQKGSQKLPGLPENSGDGTSSAKLMYGNTTNDNYFL